MKHAEIKKMNVQKSLTSLEVLLATCNLPPGNPGICSEFNQDIRTKQAPAKTSGEAHTDDEIKSAGIITCMLHGGSCLRGV